MMRIVSKTIITTLIVILAMLVGVSGWLGWQLYRGMTGESMSDLVTTLLPQVKTETEPQTRTASETGLQTDNVVETVPKTTATGDTVSVDKVEPDTGQQPTNPVPTVEEDEVTHLLAAAEADLKARRLTSPVGHNAWDKYQEALKLDSGNPEALRGMERVIEGYIDLFSAAVEQEQFEQADTYLSRIRDLHPDSPTLLDGKKRLEEARQAHADQLAEQERQRQQELERQRITGVIVEYWQAFEAAIGEENLSRATNLLNQVRALDPEETGLAGGEHRLEALRAELERQRAEAIEAHWSAFKAAIQAENLDEATGILAVVRDLSPEESGLPGGEQRLEAARAELERTRQEAEEKLGKLAGEMVDIPGGTFRMGDLSGDGSSGEKPVHSVKVPAFRMGKYEVTVGQFRLFVEATDYRTEAEHNEDEREGCVSITWDGWGWVSGRNWRNPGYSVGDEHPVVCVSWNDARSYVEWLAAQTGRAFRLPTEAEWEYAARAGSTTKYHFGDDESQLCRYGNHADASADISWGHKSCSDGVGKRTAEVGSYQPNAFGLYDMHGNVREWVQDCDNFSYEGAPSDGSAWMLGDCNRRVIRSGSYRDGPEDMRSANRSVLSISSHVPNDHQGFRVAEDK